MPVMVDPIFKAMGILAEWMQYGDTDSEPPVAVEPPSPFLRPTPPKWGSGRQYVPNTSLRAPTGGEQRLYELLDKGGWDYAPEKQGFTRPPARNVEPFGGHPTPGPGLPPLGEQEFNRFQQLLEEFEGRGGRYGGTGPATLTEAPSKGPADYLVPETKAAIQGMPDADKSQIIPELLSWLNPPAKGAGVGAAALKIGVGQGSHALPAMLGILGGATSGFSKEGEAAGIKYILDTLKKAVGAPLAKRWEKDAITKADEVARPELNALLKYREAMGKPPKDTWSMGFEMENRSKVPMLFDDIRADQIERDVNLFPGELDPERRTNEVMNVLEGLLTGGRPQADKALLPVELQHFVPPPGLKIQHEGAMGPRLPPARNPGDTALRWPSEAISTWPAGTPEQFEHFSRVYGDWLTARGATGGTAGGAGHVNMSLPRFDPNHPDFNPKELAQLLRDFAWQALQAEPLLYPPRPFFKPGSRAYSKPLVERMSSTHPEDYKKFLSSDDLSRISDILGSRSNTLRADNLGTPRASRLEYRAFLSPQDFQGYFWNFLLANAMGDRALMNKAQFPSEQADLMKYLWEKVITPNLPEIERVQRAGVRAPLAPREAMVQLPEADEMVESIASAERNTPYLERLIKDEHYNSRPKAPAGVSHHEPYVNRIPFTPTRGGRLAIPPTREAVADRGDVIDLMYDFLSAVPEEHVRNPAIAHLNFATHSGPETRFVNPSSIRDSVLDYIMGQKAEGRGSIDQLQANLEQQLRYLEMLTPR